MRKVTFWEDYTFRKTVEVPDDLDLSDYEAVRDWMDSHLAFDWSDAVETDGQEWSEQKEQSKEEE